MNLLFCFLCGVLLCVGGCKAAQPAPPDECTECYVEPQWATPNGSASHEVLWADAANSTHTTPRFSVGSSDTEKVRGGAWACQCCFEPMVGEDIHTIYRDGGEPISYLCVRCWNQLTEYQVTVYAHRWLNRLKSKGFSISSDGHRATLATVNSVRSFERQRGLSPAPNGHVVDYPLPADDTRDAMIGRLMEQ